MPRNQKKNKNNKIVVRRNRRTAQNVNKNNHTEDDARAMYGRIVTIPRSMYMADCIIVDLTYNDWGVVRTNNLGFVVSWVYRMNSIHDPDVAVGGTSVVAYGAWTTFFGAYRVLSMKYDIDIVNQEPLSSVDVFVCPTTTNVGANYSAASDLAVQPYSKLHAVSASGAGINRTHFSGVIDLGHFSGTPTQYLGNDNFGGTFGANPGAVLYFNVGGFSATAFTTAGGLDSRVKLTYRCLLSGRKVLLQV
jgi:hypothetical protein